MCTGETRKESVSMTICKAERLQLNITEAVWVHINTECNKRKQTSKEEL